MRQVGFKIVVDSSGLRNVDLKNVVSELRAIENGLKVDGRVDKGFQRNVTNLDRIKVSLEKVNPALERYVELMREAVGLSIPRQGISGGGSGINGGSRVGVNASPARVSASAFSGFVRRGESFTSQIGSVVSGASRFSSIGNLGLGVATFASAEALRQAVKIVEITREFSGASADLAARLGTTRAGVKELTDDAIRLGDGMAFTASEIVGVQVELAKLGFEKETIKQITDDVARFAVVSGGSVEDSAKLAGATLQVFEKDASQIEDVVKLLGLSTAKTAIDFESLKQGAIQLFATARSFGLELSDTLALLGALKNAGLSDSVAATASRNILLNFADDGGKLRDVLRQLGTDSVDGLEGIVGALKTLDASGINLAETFELTDKRSVNAFNTFLRGADSLEGLRDSINGSNEEFRIMERERLNSLDGDITLFKSKVDSLALSFGAEGLLRSIVQAGSGLVELNKILVDGVKSFVDFGDSANESLEKYLDLLSDTTLSEIERNKVIAELKTLYGEYIDGINIEEATLADILKLKASINSEDLRKRESISLQNEFNASLEEEEKISLRLLKAREESAKGGGFFRFGLAGNPQDGIQQKLTEKQLEIAKRLQTTDPRNISIEQFGNIRNLASRDDLVGNTAKATINRIGRFTNQYGFGGLQAQNKLQALGDGKAIKSIYDAENENIEKLKKSIDKNSIVYLQLTEIQQKNEEAKDAFRNGTGIKPTDGRKKDKKADEVFVEGSLAFFENELSKAEEVLKRISQTDDSYVKQADAVTKLRESVEVAKKRQEELTKTKRELAEEEFKQGKDSLELEFRGEKGLVNDLDKQIKTVQLEINRAEKLGEDTTQLTEKIKDLSKKYIEAYIEYYKGIQLDGASEELNRSIATNALEADERILAGENPIIVELEQAIKDSDALDEFLKFKRSQLSDADEIRKINVQIEKNLRKRGDAEVGVNVEKINERFIKESTGLTSLDVALGALKRGDLTKAQQAIDIYENEVRRLELLRDRDILLAQGDTAGAKKKEFDLELLEFDTKRQGVDRYRDSLFEVVDALGQVGSALIELQRVNIDQEEESAISKIEKEYAARIKAAQGNSAEEERLTEELERRKSEIEKKAAKERQALAIKEAIIGIALSIIQARTIAGRIAAGVVGAIQLATIRKQKFAKGGYYTGAGGQLDETGEYSTGNAILHAGEYVVRRKTVQKYPHVIRALDQDRIRYATGGGVGFNMVGGGETRLSPSDIEYMTQSLSDSVAASVYSSVMSATSRAYQESTEVLRNSRATREISRKENYSLNSY